MFKNGMRPIHPGVELAEHFVHGVDDRLRFFQLNRVT